MKTEIFLAFSQNTHGNHPKQQQMGIHNSQWTNGFLSPFFICARNFDIIDSKRNHIRWLFYNEFLYSLKCEINRFPFHRCLNWQSSQFAYPHVHDTFSAFRLTIFDGLQRSFWDSSVSQLHFVEHQNHLWTSTCTTSKFLNYCTASLKLIWF